MPATSGGQWSESHFDLPPSQSSRLLEIALPPLEQLEDKARNATNHTFPNQMHPLVPHQSIDTAHTNQNGINTNPIEQLLIGRLAGKGPHAHRLHTEEDSKAVATPDRLSTGISGSPVRSTTSVSSTAGQSLSNLELIAAFGGSVEEWASIHGDTFTAMQSAREGLPSLCVWSVHGRIIRRQLPNEDQQIFVQPSTAFIALKSSVSTGTDMDAEVYHCHASDDINTSNDGSAAMLAVQLAIVLRRRCRVHRICGENVAIIPMRWLPPQPQSTPEGNSVPQVLKPLTIDRSDPVCFKIHCSIFDQTGRPRTFVPCLTETISFPSSLSSVSYPMVILLPTSIQTIAIPECLGAPKAFDRIIIVFPRTYSPDLLSPKSNALGLLISANLSARQLVVSLQSRYKINSDKVEILEFDEEEQYSRFRTEMGHVFARTSLPAVQGLSEQFEAGSVESRILGASGSTQTSFLTHKRFVEDNVYIFRICSSILCKIGPYADFDARESAERQCKEFQSSAMHAKIEVSSTLSPEPLLEFLLPGETREQPSLSYLNRVAGTVRSTVSISKLHSQSYYSRAVPQPFLGSLIPADPGSVRVWRVDRHGVHNHQKSHTLGCYVLSSSSIYIVMHAHHRPGRRAASSVLVSWIGANAAPVDVGKFLLEQHAEIRKKTSETLLLRPLEYHYQEGDQVLQLCQALGGSTFVSGLLDADGLSNAALPAMFAVSIVAGRPYCTQVQKSCSSLRSSECFILVARVALYVWYGQFAAAESRVAALQAAQQIHRPSGIVECESGDEPSDFMAALDHPLRLPIDIAPPHTFAYAPWWSMRLLQGGMIGGRMQLHAYRVCQSSLEEHLVSFLDVWDRVYVREGKLASPASKKNVGRIVQAYCAAATGGRVIKDIYRFTAGNEPEEYTLCFPFWNREEQATLPPSKRDWWTTLWTYNPFKPNSSTMVGKLGLGRAKLKPCTTRDSGNRVPNSCEFTEEEKQGWATFASPSKLSET